MRKATLTDSLRDALTLQQAAHLFPRLPHINCIRRWATNGVRGVKLQTWLSGGKRVTTPAAVEQFLRDLNRAAEPLTDDGERRAAEAGRALEALGV